MNKNEREILRNFINRQHFNTAITLDFDYAYFDTITIESMLRTLKAWDAAINRKLLGRNWSKKLESHIEYFAFIEKPDINPHIHIAARIPKDEIAFFKTQGVIAWSKLRSTDQSMAGVRISDIYEQEGWVRYITKSCTTESWLHSNEFKPWLGVQPTSH